MNKSIFLALLVFSFLNVFSKNIGEDIRLTVAVINANDGEEIKKNVEIKVAFLDNGLAIQEKNVKGRRFFEFKPGQKIKIMVTATGFYPEEKIVETAEMNDLDTIEMRLKPNLSGSVMVRVIDKETKKPIESTVEVVFFSKTSKLDINADVPVVQYSFDIDGAYEMKANATNYINQIKSIDLKRGIGVKEVVFELEKVKQLVEISIMSQSSNLPVPIGKATVTMKEKNIKIFDGEFKNGKLSINGVDGANYSIFISAEGFNSLTESFKIGKGSPRFGLVANSTIRIDVFDENSNERVEGEMLIKSPTGKVTKLKSSKISEVVFIPNAIGNYSIETNFNGYINKIGVVSVADINGGSLFYNFRLKKGSNDFMISVFDGTTKLPIDFAKIRVFTDTNTEVQGRTVKNSKSVRLNPEKKHFFEVVAEGYLDYTQNMTDDKIMNVYLNKPKRDTLDSFYLSVLDSYNKLPVENAKLRVVENTNKIVSVKYDASNKKFVLNKLDTKGIYIMEAYAKGYKTLVDTLNMKDLPESITLVPTDFVKYKFISEDAFTKELINALVKVTTEGYGMDVESQNPSSMANLATVHSYIVDVSHPDYKGVNKPINRLESAGNEFKYKLMKNKYKVNIKFNPVITEAELQSIKGSFSSSSNVAVNNNLAFDSKENGLFVEVSPEVTYSLGIEVNGYEAYKSSLTLSQVDNKTLSFTITLKRKKEEKVIVKKEEKAIETSKKVEVKTETVEVKGIVPGKKFPLEGVQFEKSKTVMTPGHEVKLQPLVEFLKANPKATIEIVGHTDKDGADERLNVLLSAFRAKVVGNYLFNKGISTNRIKTDGKGSAEPLAASDSDENRQKNRRIEAFISEN
jgi:outer membrane protein OmpA-like peptidoglycan-associated protein